MKIINKIEGNDYSPEVIFYNNGEITIKGESRLENALDFYDKFYTELKTNIEKNREINFNKVIIEFSYISSSSASAFFRLLKKIVGEFKLKIVWVYFELDEDMFELSEIIKEYYVPDLKVKMLKD